MKKCFAILLALALLLPMGLLPTVNAAGEVTAEPFYTLGWSDFDQEKYPYLNGLVTSNFKNIGDTAILTYGGASMTYGSYTDEDVTAFAQAMKKEMESRPAGTRYWHVFGPTKILKLAPKHVLFLEHGLIQIQDLFSAALKKMKEIGCPLDGVVVDTEYIGMTSWYLYANTSHNSNNYQKNKNIYAQIVADPRYQTRIRPLLVERGFPFWPNPEGQKSEIFSICNVNKGEQYDLARSIWDTCMRIHLNTYGNEWCYAPLKLYYPEASLSDYQSHDSKSWEKLYGITDDGVALTGGSSIRVGTASSFSYYYARPGTSFFDSRKQYASFNDAVYEASAFNGFLYDINFTRHMLASTDTKQIAPWITYYSYGGKKDASMAYTPYYTELLYHLGLFDPEPFLSYTYVGDGVFNNNGGAESPHYHEIQQVKNEIMAELTRVAGYSDRKPIELPQYWNGEYVVSGMYANGRNIWRITPNTDEISLEAFKVKDSDPTFTVKGQTITFPGGKILDSATISQVGSCGYWVETAKDVYPVYTNDADRYAKYPSFGENFDSYNEGRLSATMMKPSYAWDYNASNGTSNIVTSGGDKMLALTGDVSYVNVNVPIKITAGDSYAKDQTWEMTVTVPEGLSASAEITFLKYVGTSNNGSLDAGIQIKGGKLYYSENGQLKELTDIAPGTYTFKRVMNMNDAKNFIYDLYVLGADGKEIAAKKNVATPSFNTITSISLYTKGADKAVLFDDYKLYPSGLAPDFELYDAATGINVKGADAETARDRSTAYRLSWLNGTNAKASKAVVAEIYEGGTLKEAKTVKIVEMKPGYDGVETGVVEIAAGQSVKVYLTDAANAPSSPDVPDVPGGDPDVPGADPTDPSAPTEPNQPGETENQDPAQKPDENKQDNKDEKKSGGLDTSVIVLIIVVVLGAGAVAAALFFAKKKPVKKPDAPNEE